MNFFLYENYYHKEFENQLHQICDSKRLKRIVKVLDAGDEFVDGYGYTVVVTDLPGRAKFQQKHRWLWQQHNGPIPKDHFAFSKIYSG